MQKFVIFVKKYSKIDKLKIKKYLKVREYCHYIDDIEVLHIAFII